MQHIETVTLDSAQSSITFSAIPADYTDLVVKLSARAISSGSNPDILLKFNGNSANYSSRHLFGTGSAVGSGTTPYGTDKLYALFYNFTTATANSFANSEIYIPNYRSSVAKSVSIDGVTENNDTYSFQGILAGLWNDTTAITSITLTVQIGAGFAEHSSASLYGITAGSDGIVSVA